MEKGFIKVIGGYLDFLEGEVAATI
uniref:Uncharacterized protein n=1 Tax=Arundo donax TaxID=35708 RepID=A0A0A8YFF4_ARUDO